jgi:hypothetical protein
MTPMATSVTAIATVREDAPASPTATKFMPVVLGPIPDDCQPGPAPKRITRFTGPAVGVSPVWAIGFDGPPTKLYLRADWEHTQLGWTRKVLWLVKSGSSGRVELRAWNAADKTRTPLWFEFQPGEPSTSPVLDPKNPPIPPQSTQYKEFPSYLFIPEAGCYWLEASWKGGRWRIPFAAGRER